MTCRILKVNAYQKAPIQHFFLIMQEIYLKTYATNMYNHKTKQ